MNEAIERIKNKILEAEKVGYQNGNVNHNVQPVTGHLRRALADGKSIPVEDLEWMIEALLRACQAEDAFLAKKDPERYGSKAWM